MQARQTFLLRTKLRQVNMEYSALVRDRAGERRFVRMDELEDRAPDAHRVFCSMALTAAPMCFPA